MPDYQYCEALTVALEDGVLTATLNRPDKLNAFDGELRAAIRTFINDARDDVDARVVVLTGAGGAFCSGADLTATDRRPWPTRGNEPMFAWCTELLELPKPTIAAVDGVAAGGGLGLALLCDIRICSDRARLLPIWNRRAIHPDDLVTWTLPRLVGYSRALKWLYLADEIDLQEALATGLIDSVTTPDDLLATTFELAQRLAEGPTQHYALTKQAVLRGLTREPADAAVLEAWGHDRALATSDHEEGIRAFKERRAPQFVGR